MSNLRHYLVLFSLILFSGCATLMENVPGMTHTAALMLNDGERGIMTQLEQVGLVPDRKLTLKDVYDESARGTWGYSGKFSETHIFAVFFKEGRFTRFVLKAKDAKNFQVDKDDPVLKGYLLTRSGGEIKVQELH